VKMIVKNTLTDHLRMVLWRVLCKCPPQTAAFLEEEAWVSGTADPSRRSLTTNPTRHVHDGIHLTMRDFIEACPAGARMTCSYKMRALHGHEDSPT